MIKAPYNFVPVSEKVFFPEWADRVSHDIPFSDAESGVICITITAKSPIFIRDHENSEEFCHYKTNDGGKEYYIPGSSIKGMVRNVLEIMSFSKMSFIDDKTYAVRDLSSAKNFYMKQMNLIDEPGKVSSGSVILGDLNIHENSESIVKFRGNKIGLIFQDPQTSLNPILTVGEQLIETIHNHQYHKSISSLHLSSVNVYQYLHHILFFRRVSTPY